MIPLEQVRVGDVLLVRSGERIAVDGEIVMGSGGSGAVNQAAITGASMPVGAIAEKCARAAEIHHTISAHAGAALTTHP